MENVLIIGATSAIAEATARQYAEQGAAIYMLARNEQRLNIIAEDLKVRGAKAVSYALLDVNDFDQHQSSLDKAFADLQRIDVVIIAHGTLPDQKACEQDVQLSLTEINTNAISTISLLTVLANKMEQQRQGSIAVITSVAGDRGRQSNYIYGSAKAMVSRFLQGLRNRLSSNNINVIDIKPGFVDTPMTSEFPKGALWAQPDDIASYILKAVAKGKHTVYAPFFWRYIMLIITSVPEFIFKKLKL